MKKPRNDVKSKHIIKLSLDLCAAYPLIFSDYFNLFILAHESKKKKKYFVELIT